MEKEYFIGERDKIGEPAFLIYAFWCVLCSAVRSHDNETQNDKFDRDYDREEKNIYELWCLKLRYGLEWLMLYHLSINVLRIFDNDSKKPTVYKCEGNIKCSELLVRMPLFIWLDFLCACIVDWNIYGSAIRCLCECANEHQHQRHLWLANKSDFKKTIIAIKPT